MSRVRVLPMCSPPKAENSWQVPLEPGPAAVWVVLRDGRGGAGYANYRFQVE